MRYRERGLTKRKGAKTLTVIHRIFNVNDMGSDKERESVVNAVRSMDGVSDCQLVDGSVRKIEVVYDAATVSEEDIIAKVAEEGYEAG